MLHEPPRYVTEQDYGSPALSSTHLENQAFDSNEYTYPGSPNHPATPSYNGSYQNSPYTNFSDLEFDGHIGILDEINQEYDPSDYDAPGSGSHSNLLTFGDYSGNGPQVSVSLTPPTRDNGNPYENTFDHSSPASSNGVPDAESDSRSRASSVSSSHYLPSSPPNDMTHGFESLGFGSPHWNQPHLPGDGLSPPSHKPPSPPQLLIPENSLSNEITNDRTPVINAPDGDGGLMNGPQLHIVPATPVSGGLGQTAPFMNNTLQGTYLTSFVLSSSDHLTGPSPPTWNTEATPQNNLYDRRGYNDHSALQTSNIDHYLAPQPPRIRSKSDTANRPLSWEMGSMESSSSTQRGGVNLNDILPSNGNQSQPMAHPSSAGPYQTSFNQQASPPPLQNYHSYSGGDTQFLSPDMAFGAPSLRRARSDGGRAGGHRHSRSEGGISYPPSAHSDFIARTAANSGGMQYLHPTETLPSIRGHHRRSSSGSRDRGIQGSSAGFGGHSAPGSARASPYPSPSGSPSLNYDPLPPMVPISVSGMGRGRPVSLPAYGAAALGVPSGGISALNGMGSGPTLEQQAIIDMNNANSLMVSKQNVTTTATAEASEKRRKTDANFVCPVPGCGSTFTRHFNLKGMSSHSGRVLWYADM